MMLHYLLLLIIGVVLLVAAMVDAIYALLRLNILLLCRVILFFDHTAFHKTYAFIFLIYACKYIGPWLVIFTIVVNTCQAYDFKRGQSILSTCHVLLG